MTVYSFLSVSVFWPKTSRNKKILKNLNYTSIPAQFILANHQIIKPVHNKETLCVYLQTAASSVLLWTNKMYFSGINQNSTEIKYDNFIIKMIYFV